MTCSNGHTINGPEDLVGGGRNRPRVCRFCNYERKARYRKSDRGKAMKKAEAARYYERHGERIRDHVAEYQASTAGMIVAARCELNKAHRALENA